MWIFAYGSLIFRPGFAFLERRRAFVSGWARRFWQGSPDHRGVPEAPGRVATLVESPGAWCGGVAFRVDPAVSDAVLAALDHREKAGFERRTLALFDGPEGTRFAEGLTYVADTENPHFLGPLEERAIAEAMRERRGPSGENADYARALFSALAELDIDDPHVTETVNWLDRGPRT